MGVQGRHSQGYEQKRTYVVLGMQAIMIGKREFQAAFVM
jgi:hypothetical protein